MPRRADTTNRVAGSRLCEMCGVIRQTRDKWADEGLLRKRETYDQVDLVEAVVLKLLLNTLRKKDAKLAWIQVRPQLREVVAGPQLTMVWDPQKRTAALALTADSVVALVNHGRAVYVLDLGRVVEEARDAFRRELESHAAGVAPAGQARASRSRDRGNTRATRLTDSPRASELPGGTG